MTVDSSLAIESRLDSTALPIVRHLPAIRQHLREHSKLALNAATGSGKTTIVPLALLAEPWLQDRQIIVLEPRRVAARMAARRMADLLGERVG